MSHKVQASPFISNSQVDNHIRDRQLRSLLKSRLSGQLPMLLYGSLTRRRHQHIRMSLLKPKQRLHKFDSHVHSRFLYNRLPIQINRMILRRLLHNMLQGPTTRSQRLPRHSLVAIKGPIRPLISNIIRTSFPLVRRLRGRNRNMQLHSTSRQPSGLPNRQHTNLGIQGALGGNNILMTKRTSLRNDAQRIITKRHLNRLYNRYINRIHQRYLSTKQHTSLALIAPTQETHNRNRRTYRGRGR